MFEVGRRYEFRMIEGDGEVQFWGVVEKYEHPLIKLANIPPIDDVTDAELPGQIINVTSPNFISAVAQDN